MANEVTHVTIILDQPMIQTIRMGLSALQLAASQVEVSLNKAVQSAIDAAAKAADPPKKAGGHLKGVAPAVADDEE